MRLSKLAAAASAVLLAGSFAATSFASEEAIPAEVYSPVRSGVQNKVFENGPSINVAAYNIGAARISDIDTIVTAVKALNADIIALDEVDKLTERSGKLDQAKYIAEKLGMHYAFGRTIDFQGGEYGIAILSKYPILNSEIVPLPSGDPKVDEARIVLVTEIQAEGFESPIVFMNTHLDYKEDHSIQIQQVRHINDLAVANVSLEKIEDFTTKIKILAGDFNDTYNSQNIAELERYWNLISHEDPNVMRTWPASNPMADLDHIFTSRGQVWKIQELEVLGDGARGIKWDQSSDHRPIVTKLQLVEQ